MTDPKTATSLRCRTTVVRVLALLTFLTAVSAMNAQPATAVESAGWSLQLHGYGLFGYGKTDGNPYLLGDEDGSYETGQFAIAISASRGNMRIAAQVEWETSPVFEGTKSEVDYAFAEWKFSDQAKLRLGKARHPFGIYGDILDVGTLRPFLTLPVGVYGPTGSVAEHYTGAGFSGSVGTRGWGVDYEIYGGEVLLDAAHPWEALEQVGFREDEQLRVSDLIGARVVVTTPVAGLAIGVSGYSGSGRPNRGEESIEDTHSTIGFQLEYLGEAWLVRAEIVRHRFDNRHNIDSSYLEAAYRFNRHWQLAARYDWADVDLLKAKAAREIGRKAPSLLDHQDIGVSLNYWFNDDLVVKLAYHQVAGNFFARPVRNGVREAVQNGRLDPDTELIQIGASFSF